MDIEANDIKYKRGLIVKENAINALIEDPIVSYNTSSFKKEITIKYFLNVGLINKVKYCLKCGDLMNICKRNDTIDKISFRCHKRNPEHDIKINLLNGTIFENFQIKIQIIFLIYYYFIENTSISTEYKNIKNFCQQMRLTPIKKLLPVNFLNLR